jgi:uncharacterized membrane protein (Fun14 family)
MIMAINDYFFEPLWFAAVVGGLGRVLCGLVLSSTVASAIGVVLGVIVAVAVLVLNWLDRHGKLEVEGDFLERARERERTYEQRFPH